MARSKSVVLTEKQQKIVDMKLEGATDCQATLAVYNSPNGAKARTEAIQTELKKARSEIEDQTKISRLNVLEMYLEAADMARTMSEPASLIRAADSIAKMMGYNAPEVKKLELSIESDRMKDKLMTLPVDQLLAIAEGKAVFDGEFVHVAN